MKIILCFLIFLIVGINSNDEFSTFRLKNYVRPVHYDLLLDLYIAHKYYKGTVLIEMISEQEIPPSSKHIELNSKGLDLDSYSVGLMKKDKPVQIGAIIEQDHLEKVTFLLNEDLETDTSYKLHIEFKGSFAIEENFGLLLRSYTNEDNETSNYVAANLFPVYARTVFPCFDEPHLKATFNLTLTHAPEMRGLSTMPLLQTNYGINAKGEKIIWSIFQQSPSISPSSIGIFLSSMDFQTSNSVGIWATNRNQTEQISNWPHFELFRHTLMRSVTSIHLQIPLNFVFVPDLHVETYASFGIIYVRSNDLEQKLEVGSVSGSIVANNMMNSESFIVEIAKQVAVQYFGHIVTPKWWTDVWLSESLSQYYGLLMACKFDKDRTYEDLIPSMLRNQVFDESSENSRILGENIDSSTQLMKSLSRSRTNKGVSLLFMMSDILGESIFLQGVSSYLKKFFLGSATTQDLIEEWENQLKMNNKTLPNNFTLRKILQPWLESDNEPIVNIQRIQEPIHSTLIISQMKPPNFIHKIDWYIPLHFISAKDTDYTTKPLDYYWLGPHMEDGKMSYEITIQNASGVNDWIIFNPKGSGLCRVAYDPISWELLMNQLKRNLTEIPTTARSQLIADAFSLARDGTGHYSNALELAEYLVNETSFLPWYSAFKAFEELESRLHRNKGLYKSFQMYVRNLLEVLYQKLGFESKNRDGTSDEEDYLNILLRSKTIEWACKYEIKDCIEKATFTVKQFLAGNINKIEDEYTEAIFCGGLSQADANTWNEAYNHLNHASKVKKSIILGLGCSRDPRLIESYLNKTLTEDMNSEDVIEAFNGIYRRHYNYGKVLNFMEMNIGSMRDKYGIGTINKLLIGISRYATTKHHFEQINLISSKIDANEDLMLALNQTHKSVQEMENWMIINEKNLREFFNRENTTIEHSTARCNGENILLLVFVVLYSIT